MSAPFAIRPTLEEILGLFASSTTVKGLGLSVDVASAVPNHLVGDQLWLGQVLSNLAGNSMKFTKHGRIQVRVSLAEGQEPPAPTRVKLRFDVEDRRSGKSPLNQRALFQPK